MLSLDELCALLDSLPVPQPGIESIPLADSAGRFLADDIVVPFDQPSEPMSAMDGYAFRYADLTTPAGALDVRWLASATPLGAGSAHSALPVSQRVPAGSAPQALAAGTVARIFTGAVLPPGADTVVPQEQVVSAGEGCIRLTDVPQPGQWVRKPGSELKAGAVALTAGTLLSPGAIGLVACMGLATVTVFRPLTVGLLFTGDELRQPGELLQRGQIYNSNRWMWRALLDRPYITVRDTGSVPDSLEATRRALRDLSGCDLILSSGGVSVGEEDHVRAAVELEGSLQAWKVKMKPGKPIAVGRINRPDGTHAVFAGLPGNPVSSYAGFLLLLRPLLVRMAGGRHHWSASEQMRPAAFEWTRPDPVRTEFLRVRCTPAGSLERHPNQQSAALASVAWADGFARLDAGVTVQAGDLVPYLPFSALMLP